MAAEVKAKVLLHQFGLLNINQVPFNNVARIYVHDINITEGAFSTDEGFSRSFLVTGVPIQFPPNALVNHFAVSYANLSMLLTAADHPKIEKFPSIRGVNATKLPSGLFIVSCSDIRDSMGAVGVARSILPFATIMPCTGKTYAEEMGRDTELASDYEGQMIVRIHYNTFAGAPRVEAAPIIAEIKHLLAQCGSVKAFQTIPATQNRQREIRVEFFDADSVFDAVKLIHKIVLKVCLSLSSSVLADFSRMALFSMLDHISQMFVTLMSREMSLSRSPSQVAPESHSMTSTIALLTA